MALCNKVGSLLRQQWISRIISVPVSSIMLNSIRCTSYQPYSFPKSRMIICRGLEDGINDQALYDKFSPDGELKEVGIVTTTSASGRAERSGFVRFADDIDGIFAVGCYNAMMFNGQQITFKFAREASYSYQYLSDQCADLSDCCYGSNGQ